MSATHTSSGGAYYQTAVDLRADARRARESYPSAVEIAEANPRRMEHATNLIVQAVGLELAAALYCVAQAIEDQTPYRVGPRQSL